jgi:hypothetical protein
MSALVPRAPVPPTFGRGEYVAAVPRVLEMPRVVSIVRSGDRKIAIELATATGMLWDAHGFNDRGARVYCAIESRQSAARVCFALAGLRMRTEAQRRAGCSKGGWLLTQP